MSLLRVYIAVSLDGYIADEDGGVAWLDPYFSPEIDFTAFIRTIGATVMGRKTYDQARARGEWPYADQRVVVLTHRSLDDAPPGVEAFAGDVRELADRLRGDLEETGKDVWLMGGGDSIRPFHDAGLVDRWELFFIPILLGDGVPLFPRRDPRASSWRPTHSRTYENGIVEIWYEPASAERTAEGG